MNFGPISPSELKLFVPYGILSLGAFLLLIASIGKKKSESKTLFALATALTIAATSVSLFALEGFTNGFLIHDHLGFCFAQTLLLLLFLVVPLLPTNTPVLQERPSLVYSLLLLSACGGLLMINGDHLLLIFVGLELLSIPLYVLTGLGADSKKGSEAAFKYFLLGAISSAIFIYGVALLWGAIGTVKISEMKFALYQTPLPSPSLATFAFALIMAGIVFKLGMVPFQMWVPDVYEGAPSPIVAWMSGGVKAAAFVVAIRLLATQLPFTGVSWSMILGGIAILSMAWGSFGALYQTNLKRMLGYSAIAHAGYACIALVCVADGASLEAGGSLAFYVLTYGLASLSSFIVISLEEGEGRTQLSDLSGLALRKPGLAFALGISLLSLAGLPPLGGFIGKFNILTLAAQKGHYGLVFVAVITSVISLGYYLRLIVAAYMEKPTHITALPVRWATGAALSLSALMTLILGMIPGSMIDFFFKSGH